jgi:sterol desaturase/sphingolipid hydroxylase (fatty acid hydroxylase superfamily)
MVGLSRLITLIIGCAVLWSVESLAPLYLQPNRFRRSQPNIALAVLLIGTNLAFSFATAAVATFTAQHGLGILSLVKMPLWLATLSGVAALDLFTYVAHVLLHKSGIGWQFHRIHHSDNQVNVTTAFRQHPGETLWRILWQILAIALFGIPLWMLAIYLLISTVNAQLEHANVCVAEPVDRVLRLLFVTPNMHKVHHSRLQFQTDTNYSNILSVWDRVFGTYTGRVDFDQLSYGLDGFDDEDEQTLKALLWTPFSAHGHESRP